MRTGMSQPRLLTTDGHISPTPVGGRYSSSSADAAEAALAAAGRFWQCQGSAGLRRGFFLRRLSRMALLMGSPVRVLVPSWILPSRPAAAEQAPQDQGTGNPALCCAAQLCCHIWEHITESADVRCSPGCGFLHHFL